MNKLSYTAASTFPVKLFSTPRIVPSVVARKIRPFHVQVNPTNKCPLNCSFCSCRNRDKTAELSLKDLTKISDEMISLGAKAFTITGGGEPLAHKGLPEYVHWLKGNDMSVALVTNGILFNRLESLDFLTKLSWCRISLSDERELRPYEIDAVVKGAKYLKAPSFSYVVTTGRLDRIVKAVDYANCHGNFTHIRMVDDIVAGSRISLADIKGTLEKHGIDVSRVIWQGRKEFTRGHRRCLVSLHKPNIDVYGNMTGCCGVQYASNPPMLDFTRAVRICDKNGVKKVYEEQRYFDGSVCERCYYGDYNNALNAMWDASTVDHEEFG